MNQSLEISTKTIFKILFVLLIFYFLLQSWEILLWILYALVISVLMEGPIGFLKRQKIPTPISALLVYFSFFLILISLIYLFSLPIYGEIQNLISSFPEYLEKILPILKPLGVVVTKNVEELTLDFQKFVFSASKSIFGAISAFFGGILATFSIFSLAFFFSIEEEGIEKIISLLFKEKKEFALQVWKETKEKISGWFGARILGCLFVFFLTLVSLLVLKINAPFSLSFFAGVLNFIPLIGPILTGIFLFLIALLDSYFKAIFILILFLLIQQIENNIISPILLKRFIQLPPSLVLISLLVGGKLLGLTGAIFAVPLAGIFFKISEEILK